MSVKTTETEVLAKFVSELSIDQIPAGVKTKAIRHTLDSLGVAVS